jgi:hypothetical protein
MTPDQPSLEAELRDLHAATLDEALLARLEAAADGTLTRLSPGESRFEELLRESSPARLSPRFTASLESILSEVPFPVDGKILLFPKAAVRARQPRPIWGAAAAVALIGAITALMIPAGKAPVNPTRQVAVTSPPVTAPANPNLVPASFNRGLSEVHDEGVVWKSNNQPHTVVRVVYKDLLTLKDTNGRTFQVEQPRVEYMLVPAKTD